MEAIKGGASGIRAQGIDNLTYFKKVITVPIIGLVKTCFEDGTVAITRDFDDFKRIVDIGITIVAVDGTERIYNQCSGPDFIYKCKSEFPEVEIVADISTTKDAHLCHEIGSDAIATTLRGYTPETKETITELFDLIFLRQLINQLPNSKIIAEGRISTVNNLEEIKQYKPYLIVVGKSITDPCTLTRKYSR